MEDLPMSETRDDGLPISKRYQGSICEVKSLNNETLASGCISEISDQYIKISNSKDIINILRYNTRVKLCVHNVRLGMKVLVGSVYLSTAQFMLVADVSTLSDFEKRGFFRMRVSITGKIVLAGRENDPRDAWDVDICDMSLGGLLLCSKHAFDVGDKFFIDFDLPGGPLHLLCCVRRVIQETGNDSEEKDEGEAGKKNTTYYKYGCQLMNCTDKEEDLLWKYILRLQREEILKQKGSRHYE
jgi:hypothetical protein